PGPAGIEQGPDLARHQAEIDGDEHGAELGRGEQRLDEWSAVVEQHGDAVALANPECGQAIREPARALVERRVGQPARTEGNCDGIRTPRGVDGELVADHRGSPWEMEPAARFEPGI